jgi:hypothetical protein
VTIRLYTRVSVFYDVEMTRYWSDLELPSDGKPPTSGSFS